MSRIHIIRASVAVRAAMRHLEKAEGEAAVEASELLLIVSALLLAAGNVSKEEVEDALQGAT